MEIAHKDITYKPLAWQLLGLQYTASGYGTKIPTRWIDGFLMASYEERFECDEPWNEDLYGDNPFEDEEGEE